MRCIIDIYIYLNAKLERFDFTQNKNIMNGTKQSMN
jgi:hypothetical protein